MDTWVEMLEENSETNTPGKAANIDLTSAFAGIPVPVPSKFGISSYEATQFKAATITKLVQRPPMTISPFYHRMMVPSTT